MNENMTHEAGTPAAPPPLASWWDDTGMLYVGLSVLGAVAGGALAQLVWSSQPQQSTQGTMSIAAIVLSQVQFGSFHGAAIGIAQWIVLHRLVRRALRAVSGRGLSQPERRLSRDTALWIVATVAGGSAASALGGAISGLLVQAQAYALLGLPSVILHGLLGGGVLGTAQWLVLRRHVPGARTWIRSTIGGNLLGQFVSYFAWRFMLARLMSASPTTASLTTGQQMLLGAVWTVPAILILAVFQARRLKRLAPGWLERMHGAARKEGSVGRNRVAGSGTGTGS